MKLIPNISIYSLGAFLLMLTACGSNAETGVHSTKRERNSIKEGNTHFAQQRYADAEISYKKALEENPDNATAQFNLASSYIKQRGNDVANKADSLIRTADAILTSVSGQQNIQLAQKAYYDRGNLAYKAEDYAAAIEHYKNALRRNPDDDMARDNLRLAQLKSRNRTRIKTRIKIRTTNSRTRIRIWINRIRSRTKTSRIRTRTRTKIISKTNRISKTALSRIRKIKNRNSNRAV